MNQTCYGHKMPECRWQDSHPINLLIERRWLMIFSFDDSIDMRAVVLHFSVSRSTKPSFADIRATFQMLLLKISVLNGQVQWQNHKPNASMIN